MQFAVVSLATLISEAEADLCARAVHLQLARDVGPTWGLEPSRVVLFPDLACVPAGWWQILMVDRTEVLGAYGYHGLTPEGLPYGRVDVGECLAMGGTATHGASSVSVTLAHEIGETAIDPFLDQWMLAPNGDEWAKEPFDPTEGTPYDVQIDGSPVAVSNFVTPAFYVAGATLGFDWLGRLRSPFSIDAGGYTVLRHPDGSTSQWPPERRLRDSKLHPASRTAQRLKG